MATIDQYKIVVDVQGEQAVSRLRDGIAGLGSVIAGIGIAAFTQSLFNLADSISDLADATGLAVGEVAAFRNAVAMAGGEADNAGKMITKFYQNMEQAAEGSEKAQDALAKVGIGLNELRTLSEGELLAKAIDNLAKMDAGAQRTAAGMELFGKSFAQLDPAKLKEILDTQDVTKLQEEIARIGQINDNVQASFMNLQMAAIGALSAILGPVDNFKLSLEQAEKLIKIVGAALAITFAASMVRNIITVVGAIKTLTNALRATAVAQAIVTSLTGPAGWAALAASAAAAGAAIYAINKTLDGATADTKALGDAAVSTGKKFGQMNAGRGAFPGATGVSKQDADARRQAALAARQTTEEMIRQNKEANELRQLTIGLIGMESTRANNIRANAQAEADGRKQIAALDAKIEQERAKGRGTNQQVIDELIKQKGIISAQVQETIRLNNEEAKRTIELQKQRDLMSAANELTSMAAQRIINAEKARNQELVIQGRLTQDQANYLNQQFTLQEEHLAKLAELNMALGKAEEDKDEAAISRLKVAIGMEKTRFLDASKNLETLRQQQEALDNSAAAGAISAMERVKKSITPFQVAQEQTMLLFDRMGQGLDEFVKTGKLNFKNFALSLIRDLLLIQIKAQAMKWLSGALGGSFLGSIFGLATGGPAKAGQPYIVGEKGPELFVPKSAGTVIPNDVISKPQTSASMQAPNSGPHNTYITNNISALDAKSVAQLFVENRKTLLGTVNMAKKELPYAF